MNDIGTRVQMYLQDNGIVNTSTFDSGHLVYDDGTGVKINWTNNTLPKPILKDLSKYSDADVAKFKRNKKSAEDMDYLMNHKLFKLLKLICSKTGIDIKELLEEYKNLDQLHT